MAWLIRMAGLRDLRRDDGVYDLPADVLGDGMSELTLQYQLKQLNDRHMEYAAGLQAKIEQLERDLAAEKALADKLEKAVSDLLNSGETGITVHAGYVALSAYRKARGIK